jgi:hypothetical protein
MALLPLIFAIIHISWAVGFFVGLVRFGIPRFSRETLRSMLRPH